MNTHATQVVEALGGTAAVARIFGVAMPSVSDWKKDGIPSARMMYLQATRKKELAGIDLNAALSAPKKQATQGHKEAANG